MEKIAFRSFRLNIGLRLFKERTMIRYMAFSFKCRYMHFRDEFRRTVALAVEFLYDILYDCKRKHEKIEQTTTMLARSCRRMYSERSKRYPSCHLIVIPPCGTGHRRAHISPLRRYNSELLNSVCKHLMPVDTAIKNKRWPRSDRERENRTHEDTCHV